MAPPSGRPRFSLAEHAYWMGPLAAPTIALTVWLLLLGEKGATLAQVIGLPFVIYATGAALFARAEQVGNRRRFSGRRRITIAAMTLVIGGLLPSAGWFWYDRYHDKEVRVGKAFQLTEQTPAIVVPKLKRPGWQGELRFTPRLTAISTLGDCVLPARLMVGPVVDGQHLKVVEARNNTEAKIAIPSGVTDVELDISLVVPPNQSCVLNVTLAQPVLHR
jgi:hypothetical protein